MHSVLRRVAILAGIVGIFSLVIGSFIGCGHVSPFSAAVFNTKLVGLASGGPTPTEPTTPTNGTTASVCDLDPLLQGISVTIANASEQFVRFSMTFAASAGTGGWVCDGEIQDYINAGYIDALVPGSGNTITVGCDTLTLLSGSRLLTMEFGINQGVQQRLAPGTGTDPNNLTPTTLQLTRRDNGSPIIPLPEIIVFGNSNANFICVGGSTLGDLCTQRGFVYGNSSDLPIGKAVEATRLQGTVCNTGFGTAPEWRLDKTVFDTAVQPFQFAAGGTIVATVLNRASDPLTETRNQAVWLVTDGAGATIHFPAP